MTDFVRKKSQHVIFWIISYTTCLVLSRNVHHLSNFESKTLQSIRFCFMKFKASQFLSWKKQTVQFWKKLYSNFTWIILFRKIDMFCPLRAFSKAFFWKKTVCIVSDLSWTKSERVRFWFKSFTTCKILKRKFYNVSNFNLKVSARIIIWNKIIRTFRAVK